MPKLLHKILIIIATGLVTGGLALPAHAIMTIEITQGVEGGIPIAIVPFQHTGKPTEVSDIIQADLARSGRLTPLDPAKMPSRPASAAEIDFKTWRLMKMEAIVIGSVSTLADGRVRIDFRLYDVYKSRQLLGLRYTVAAGHLRSAAHRIADKIYERLTGEPGVFDTRIAYISKEMQGRRSRFSLQVADADGHNPKTIVRSPEPLMSPAWSPDGRRLAYVSFERRRSMVYVQDVASGRRSLIASFEGINSAPAWSPDGRRLALTLSRDGNPEIYIYDIANRHLQRLTTHRAIDTEAIFTPDGRHIIFTSDRSGGPQIYQKPIAGGAVKRLSFTGNYNARAMIAPDGKTIAFVTRRKGRYNIAILGLNDNREQVLTDTHLDESPSFSPNGRMILYATATQNRGVLASVSSDGRVRQLFRLSEGDIREPAWAPYARR